MKTHLSRRNIMKALGASALGSSLPRGASAAFSDWPKMEGPNTPKLCLGVGRLEEVSLREVKQLGVEYVLRGGPRGLPWPESELRQMMDTVKSAGLTLGNLMIAGFPNTIYGRPGRDEEIEKVQQS